MSDKLLAPAAVAVVFTGITNWFLEKRKAGRDLATKIADGLRDDLKSLQALAVEYWSRPYAKGDKTLEARITAAQTDVMSTLSLLEDEFHLPICTPDDPRSELLDSLTGGAYGTVHRGADVDRVRRASAILTDLRMRVIRHRAASLRRSGM